MLINGTDNEARKRTLLAEHARLMNEGFPARETQRFWLRVSELPTDHQDEIRRLCDIAQDLKRGLGRAAGR
jgi:hypothetical protein